MSIEVIQVGPDATAIPIQIGDVTVVEITIPNPGTGGGGGATRLDDLDDVAGADAGAVGQALVKDSDSVWRPATLSGGGVVALAYTHTQDSPSTVWLITHGLGFDPAGIEVIDHIGQRHYPQLSYPSAAVSVRLDFDDSVRGTARLS